MKKKSKHSDEARAKMRISHTGKKIDEPTKAKIRATMRRKWSLIREIEERAA